MNINDLPKKVIKPSEKSFKDGDGVNWNITASGKYQGNNIKDVINEYQKDTQPTSQPQSNKTDNSIGQKIVDTEKQIKNNEKGE